MTGGGAPGADAEGLDANGFNDEKVGSDGSDENQPFFSGSGGGAATA